MSKRLVSLLFLLVGTIAAYASEKHEDRSEILLVSGEAMAAGGMSAITPLNVCDPASLDRNTIGPLLGSALTEISLSMDPSPDDNYQAIGIGKAWNTVPAALAIGQIEEYNHDASEKLPTDSKLYFRFADGVISVNDNLFTLSTHTILELGTSFQWREPFTGSYSSRYFHNKLKVVLEQELVKYGCKK